MGWFSSICSAVSSACSWVADKASKAYNWVKENAVTVAATVAATAAVVFLAPISVPALSMAFVGGCAKAVACATVAGAVAGGVTGGVKAKINGTSVKDGVWSGVKSGARTGAITGAASVACGIAGHYIGGQIGGGIGSKGVEKAAENFGEIFGSTGGPFAKTVGKAIGHVVGKMSGQVTGAVTGKVVGGAAGLMTSGNERKKQDEKEEHQLNFNTEKKNEADVKKLSNANAAAQLFKDGKSQETYNKSLVGENYNNYQTNIKKSQNEIKARELNSVGTQIFSQGQYQKSQNISNVAEQRTKHQPNINLVQQKTDNFARSELSRLSAIRLNEEGIELYNQGRYQDAKEKLTQVYKYLNDNKNSYFIMYSTNLSVNSCQQYLTKVQIEIDAISLNKQGEDFFAEGKYQEAQERYREAYYKSQVLKERRIYENNKFKTDAEIEASKLCEQGEKYFADKLYNLAASKYKEAIKKTTVKAQQEKYTKDLNDTQREIDAQTLNQQGDSLFNQGKYEQALEKYSDAWTKASLKAKNYLHYSENKKKAQNEVNAINLSLEGDKLLSEDKHIEAVQKYQEAYNTSNLQKGDCLKKQQYAESKLDEHLKQMMSDGWEAENKDNSEEAENIFNQVLKFAKDRLKFAKDNQIYIDHTKCIELKIAGNEIFNAASEFNQGLTELEILENRKTQYLLALDKYNEGLKYDQNFQNSIDIVHSELNFIDDAIGEYKIKEQEYNITQKCKNELHLFNDYASVLNHQENNYDYDEHKIELTGQISLGVVYHA